MCKRMTSGCCVSRAAVGGDVTRTRQMCNALESVQRFRGEQYVVGVDVTGDSANRLQCVAAPEERRGERLCSHSKALTVNYDISLPVTGVSALSNLCGVVTKPTPLARSLDDVLDALSDESIGRKRGLGQRRGHSAHDIDATRRRRLAVAAQHLSTKGGGGREIACRGTEGHSNGHGSVKPPSSVTGRTRFPMACSTRCVLRTVPLGGAGQGGGCAGRTPPASSSAPRRRRRRRVCPRAIKCALVALSGKAERPQLLLRPTSRVGSRACACAVAWAGGAVPCAVRRPCRPRGQRWVMPVQAFSCSSPHQQNGGFRERTRDSLDTKQPHLASASHRRTSNLRS